jgi:hypothetical protein
MNRLYLIGFVVILLSVSCEDNSLKKVTSSNFVGTWDVNARVERYISGVYDENYFYSPGNKELLLRQDGTGLMTPDYSNLELIWAYVPTRQKIYFNVTDSPYSSFFIKDVVEVKNNSQLWESEFTIADTTYLTTWELELR